MDLSRHDKAILGRVFCPECPEGDDLTPEEDTSQQNKYAADVLLKIKSCELDSVKDAESGKLEISLDKLSQLITSYPEYPSAYNNRAQVYQLLGNKEAAYTDLEKALHLSEGCGQVACQAYTQRAVLKKAEEFDEDAMEDFKRAASLGGKFARMKLVELNPYAALCNNMLNQVFREMANRRDDPSA